MCVALVRVHWCPGLGARLQPSAPAGFPFKANWERRDERRGEERGEGDWRGGLERGEWDWREERRGGLERGEGRRLRRGGEGDWAHTHTHTVSA